MGPGFLEITTERGVERLALTGQVLRWPPPPETPRLELHEEAEGVRLLLLAERDVPPGGGRELRLEPGEPRRLPHLGLCLQREAQLEELPPPAGTAGATEAGDLLRAGLLVEAGLVPTTLRGRLERSVLDGSFEPVAAAAEIRAQARTTAETESLLRQRAGRLLRDFVMARRQRGLQRALRRGREGARSLLAALLVQGLALGVYSLIVALLLLFWRARGHSLDGLLDVLLAPFSGSAR